MSTKKSLMLIAWCICIIGMLAACQFLGGINSRDEIASDIETAINNACDLEIIVEPSTVPVYDIDYWSTVLQESNTRITCVAGNSNWSCDCDDR